MRQPPQHTIHFSQLYASVCGLLLARNVVFQLATLAHQVALLLHTVIEFLCPPCTSLGQLGQSSSQLSPEHLVIKCGIGQSQPAHFTDIS